MQATPCPSWTHFYPRSPCGERQLHLTHKKTHLTYFYPRSPCGERHNGLVQLRALTHISIHALLAESDGVICRIIRDRPNISIHALLAESDLDSSVALPPHEQISIHALLAESDFDELVLPEGMDISIHALLAESDFSVSVDSFISVIFLSTLSLRRATSPDGRRICNRPYFYPRSPCGERPALYCVFSALAPISIHALLAESDVKLQLYFINQKQFLSTLSLRRATQYPSPSR